MGKKIKAYITSRINPHPPPSRGGGWGEGEFDIIYKQVNKCWP